MVYIDSIPHTATMVSQIDQIAASAQTQRSPMIPDRQLRSRLSVAGRDSKTTSSPRRQHSSTVSSHRKGLEASSGAQRRQSRNITTSASSNFAIMEAYQTLPQVRTKTGRVSRALKGRKVHKCIPCDKVAEHDQTRCIMANVPLVL
jgi:hypothetical protein